MKFKPQLCHPYNLRSWKELEDMNYVFEEKCDGERVIAYVRDKKVKLINRNGVDKTSTFPEIEEDLKRFNDCVLDGEIVAFNQDRISDFFLLSKRSHLVSPSDQIRQEIKVFFEVFDILEMMGRPVWLRSFKDRRIILENFFGTMEALYPTKWTEIIHQFKSGENAWNYIGSREGVIAKREVEPYHAGQRLNAWLKIKKTKELMLFALRFEPTEHEEVLICDKEVRVAVGDLSERQKIKDLLNAGKHPVVEIEYLGRTPDGKLRMPVYKGLRSLDV